MIAEFKIYEIVLQFAAGIKVLEERNTQLQKANADADVVEHHKQRRSLNELIGYNQNIDRNLEISIMVFSFKKCLEQTLLVP